MTSQNQETTASQSSVVDIVRATVIETMNALEHEYGVSDLESFGSPTVDEITERVIAKHFYAAAPRA